MAELLTISNGKANFYITESGAFRNRVLYFRHDDWQTLCKPLVEKLSADTFQRLSQVRTSLSLISCSMLIGVW